MDPLDPCGPTAKSELGPVIDPGSERFLTESRLVSVFFCVFYVSITAVSVGPGGVVPRPRAWYQGVWSHDRERGSMGCGSTAVSVGPGGVVPRP